MTEKNRNRRFFKYTSQSMLAMVGTSLYVLADTYFIAQAVGANGITALNIVTPVYSLIFGLGAMIGIGSAIRFSIEKITNMEDAKLYFPNALFFQTLISLVFIVGGAFWPKEIITFLGGTPDIALAGETYTRLFMVLSPCFMWNFTFSAFCRNDGAPQIAMTATIISSAFNIWGDYFFMFPCKMGMAGAALATGISPLINIAVCGIHIFSARSNVKICRICPSWREVFHSCRVGISAFIGEMSSGIVVLVLNFLILSLAGNIGVAAYSAIANTAVVVMAMFNGVAQGIQPLISEAYGGGKETEIRRILRKAILMAEIMAVMAIVAVNIWTVPIANLFNSEQLEELTRYATEGLRLYYLGFIFAGFNLVGISAVSAVESVRWSFVLSILRGFVMIVIWAFVLARLGGMRGIWLTFPIAEATTMILTFVALKKKQYI